MTSDNTVDFIEEFFKEDNGLSPNGLNRNSVFLCAFRDMQFCNGITFRKFEQNGSISKQQEELIFRHLPIFSYFLTYFSAIDTLARVMNMRQPNPQTRGEVQAFFKESAKNWFEINDDHLVPLWNLRNGLTHHYHLNQDGIRPHGAELMTPRNENGSWSISVTAAFGTVRTARKNAYEFIRSKTTEEQQPYNEYIGKNGFIYT